MGAFYDTHKDLVDAERIDATGTQYIRMDENDTILEHWTKEDGQWVDITARSQLAQKIERLQHKLDKLKEED